MKRAAQLQPPVVPIARDPGVRIEFADQEDPDVEAAVDRWLRSLLDSPGTPEEGGQR